MSLYRDLVETSFHTDLLYHQFVVLQGSNKNTIKSHWSIRRPLADASWPRRHAVPDGKTMNDNAPLSLWGNFRRVELWGCVCCTIICADLSPPPGWVVPETRDPLKPDDNFRRGVVGVSVDDTDTILSPSEHLSYYPRRWKVWGLWIVFIADRLRSTTLWRSADPTTEKLRTRLKNCRKLKT